MSCLALTTPCRTHACDRIGNAKFVALAMYNQAICRVSPYVNAQEEQQDHGTVALAKSLLARAAEQQQSLKQHMFYVETDHDQNCRVRFTMCQLQLSVNEVDTESLENAIDALIQLAPAFNTLWLAATRLRQGAHRTTVDAVIAATA